jgi:hypothetical protein
LTLLAYSQPTPIRSTSSRCWRSSDNSRAQGDVVLLQSRGILLSCYLRTYTQCFSGKPMRLKSSELPNLILRLKLAINPATRLFLVVLFAYGFTSSYLVHFRFKTHPQYAANPEVGNHPPDPAIIFLHTDEGRVVALSTPWGPFESANPHHAPATSFGAKRPNDSLNRVNSFSPGPGSRTYENSRSFRCSADSLRERCREACDDAR